MTERRKLYEHQQQECSVPRGDGRGKTSQEHQGRPEWLEHCGQRGGRWDVARKFQKDWIMCMY